MLPLLIATLEGDIDVHDPDEVYPLGRSFLRRVASRTAKAANPVSQVRNVAHGVAKIGRATGRVGMQLSRGNVKGAFVDLGRAVTTTVTTPLTMAVGVVDRSAASKLEGVIARNDPAALINRKIFEAVKAAVRPIVSKFAGDFEDGFGEDAAVPTTKKAAIRAARGKIIAASTAAGTAAGTAVAGPYGAPVGAALVPAAVDAIIEEIGNKKSATAPAAPAEDTTAPAEETAKTGIPTGVKIGAAAAGAFLLYKVLR